MSILLSQFANAGGKSDYLNVEVLIVSGGGGGANYYGGSGPGYTGRGGGGAVYSGKIPIRLGSTCYVGVGAGGPGFSDPNNYGSGTNGGISYIVTPDGITDVEGGGGGGSFTLGKVGGTGGGGYGYFGFPTDYVEGARSVYASGSARVAAVSNDTNNFSKVNVFTYDYNLTSDANGTYHGYPQALASYLTYGNYTSVITYVYDGGGAGGPFGTPFVSNISGISSSYGSGKVTTNIGDGGNTTGGNGRSGVVIIRYLDAGLFNPATITGGGQQLISGTPGYLTYQFTGNGTFVIQKNLGYQ